VLRASSNAPELGHGLEIFAELASLRPTPLNTPCKQSCHGREKNISRALIGDIRESSAYHIEHIVQTDIASS
jgi:hypothetical protein